MVESLGSSFIIRNAVIPDDYLDIIDLWETAGSGIQLSSSDSIEEITKKQLRDPELFLVAEENKRITAAVLGGFDGRRGIVYHLAVREEYRDQGLGEGLMIELEKRWKKLGCIRSYLLITPGNLKARQFYENRNWEIEDLLIMAKDL